MVKPGDKVSIYIHHHRAEHCVMVSCTDKVNVEDKKYFWLIINQHE
jgi:hypothetical protein